MTAFAGRVAGVGNRLRRSLPAGRGRRAGGAAVRARTRELTAAAALAQWMLLAVAGLALWLAAFGIGLSGLEEQHHQHDLYASFRKQLADGVAPLGGVMRRGAPVTLLESDRGGLRGVVAVEGTSSSQLRAGPGHYPGTVLPGQVGVSTFFGRGSSFGAPFRGIAKLRKGDVVVATTAQGAFRYVVEGVRRPGDPFPSPLAPGGSQLTLMSSEGSGWRSVWAPTHAVFVDAVLTGKSVPAPTSVGIAQTSDQAMHGDTSGLYPLVLWLQLLVLAVVAIAIGRSRWGRWQTWLVGGPAVLTAVWGISQTAWLLLPNVV